MRPSGPKAPSATICLDALHVVASSTKALAEVLRRLAAELRTAGRRTQRRG